MNKQYLERARAFEANRHKWSQAELEQEARKFTKWMMAGIAQPGGLLDLADKCEAVVKAMKERERKEKQK
jgi:hypothetical protein